MITSSLLPQERDSLIQLYPGLGDTLDLFNRNYFEIFQDIEGFEYTVFFIMDNKYLVSNVTYSSDGILKDTIFTQPLSALDNARKSIDKIEKKSGEKLEDAIDAIVSLKDERLIKGRLSMFSKSHLYLISENEDENKILKSNALKIRLLNVNQINILGQTRTWSYAGWGALTGLAIGGLVYQSSEEDYSTSPGIGGFGLGGLELISTPILGGLVGLLIGSASSTDDEMIQIESQYDFLKLKNYAKYYFRYDESIEQKYVEIE